MMAAGEFPSAVLSLQKQIADTRIKVTSMWGL
jgi:hypothetical protein